MSQLVCESKLTDMIEVHEFLNRCGVIYDEHETGDTVSIDLSKLQFVSALGVVILLATTKTLDKYFYLDVIVPSSPRVIGYLERMDFFKLCPDDVRLDFEGQVAMQVYYDRIRKNRSRVLLELEESFQDKDIINLHKAVTRIMRDKGLSPNRVSDIASIASELGNNAIEHGKSPCYSCIQYYPFKNVVEIAICDTGMGIYNNLKSILSNLDPDEVVEKALLTKTSRLNEQDRGKGLLEVRYRTFKWAKDALFFLRTHNSVYRVSNEKIELYDNGDYFFGTYYHIIIRTP